MLDRSLIQRYMTLAGLQVSLDETHPAGDPLVDALWQLAETGADAQGFAGPEVAEEAARWVAAALACANFGPEFIASAFSRETLA